MSPSKRNQAFPATGPTKHLEVLEELFLDIENTWRSSEPARKGYAGTMFLYKKELTQASAFQKSSTSAMNRKDAYYPKFDTFFVTQVYLQRR